MKAVILAGGQELSRCPLAMVRPRPLFPLLTDVLLSSQLRLLHSIDVDEAVICANGKTRVLREHFLERPSRHVSVDFYDDELPRGTAGCVKDVEGFLGKEPFFVLEGGLFLEGGLAELAEDHTKSGAAMTVAAVPAAEWRRGDGVETQGGSMSPLGAYVAEPDILKHVPDHGYFDLKEQLLPKLRQAGAKAAVSRYCGRHRRVADARGYAGFVGELLLSVFGADPFDGLTEVAPHVWQADGGWVEPSATLLGPVVIGRDAVVGAGAVVAGPTLIGEGVCVSDTAYVESSILWPRASIGYGARVEHAIVTDGYRVRALSSLSRCVAVDKQLKLGDLHGLTLSGYGVAPQPALGAHTRSSISVGNALSKLWSSVKSMREGRAVEPASGPPRS